MATAADIFSHATPQYFADEAPVSSGNIGTRILNTALDYADAVIRAKYGDRSGIPVAGSTSSNAVGARYPVNPAGDSSMLILIVLAVFLLLILRR